MQCVWLVYLLTKFIGAVLFARLSRILYYANLLADGLSVRLKSLSGAGTKAAAHQPDNDWSYGEDQGLHTGVNLCPPSGSNSPPAGRIVSCQLPWGGLTLFYWLPGHSSGEGVNPWLVGLWPHHGSLLSSRVGGGLLLPLISAPVSGLGALKGFLLKLFVLLFPCCWGNCGRDLDSDMQTNTHPTSAK